MVQKKSDRRGRRRASVGVLTPSDAPHAVGGRRKQLNTQGVTHRIVNTLSILRDLGDPYTSEYPAPQCMADVEA